MSVHEKKPSSPEQIFSGNIYIFHALDIGDDINLEAIEKDQELITRPLAQPRYFKNYHMPLSAELPHPYTSSKCISTKIYNFGAVSLIYKMPFEDTLSNVRKEIDALYNQYQKQSLSDASTLFKKIKKHTQQAQFFQMRSSYVVIQVDPIPAIMDVDNFKRQYGNTIASTLRFETETLSASQKNDILEGSAGYYRGDLMVVDIDASFAYNAEFEETIDFFEFANIQQLELHYFDRVLDQLLNTIYEGKVRKLPIKAYLPFFSTSGAGPMADLGKLRVDISVITERLESNIKLMGEPYFSELYALLSEKLDLPNWKTSIEKKLSIVQDIQNVYQHNLENVRQDILEVLIIVLIFIEVIIGLVR